VGRGLSRQIERSRTGIRLVSRVLAPVGEVENHARLAEAHHDAAARAELAAVSGWAPERVAALAAACAAEQRYADFLDRLTVGKRTLLIGRHTGREGVARLADPAQREALERALEPMVDVRIPDGTEALFAVARETPAREAERRAFAAAWNAAVGRAAAALTARAGGETPENWLATAPAAEAGAWRREAAALGFAITPDTFELVRRQLANARLRRLLLQQLDSAAGNRCDVDTCPGAYCHCLLLLPPPRSGAATGLKSGGLRPDSLYWGFDCSLTPYGEENICRALAF